MCNLIKNFIRMKFLYSFKATILTFFLPVITFSIIMTGWISYRLATSQIEDNVYTNTQYTLSQTKTLLESKLADTFEQLVQLSNDPVMQTIINKNPSEISPDDYLKIDRMLNTIYYDSNSLIDSILISLHNGNFVVTKNENQVENIRTNAELYRKKYQHLNDGYYWKTIPPGDNLNASGNEVITVFKRLRKEDSRTDGLILFNLKQEYFENVINRSLIGENGYLVLISPTSVLTYKKIDEKYRLDQDILLSINAEQKNNGKVELQKHDGEKMLGIYDTLSVNKWKVASVFPESEIFKKVNYMKYVTLYIVIILLVIAIFIGSVLTKFITKPLSTFVEKMDKLGKENLTFKIDGNVPSEISLLQSRFKDLLERTENLLQEVRKEQDEKRQLELEVMHTQINPHFLYNTLYSIKGLCDMGMNKEASKMITALSSFFRISISKGQEIIPVKEEIEHISNYLLIQEMRYGDNFSYEIDVDPNILKYKIIKLTLQPLVENAIYHGVKQKRGKGMIQIKGYQTEENICFEVIDNGAGMSEEKLEEIRQYLFEKNKKSKIGFGIYSVHERIRIHYGSPYGLKIKSQEGIGSTFQITIPKVEG
jgi:two-component system, sensor histidine kinase YesM